MNRQRYLLPIAAVLIAGGALAWWVMAGSAPAATTAVAEPRALVSTAAVATGALSRRIEAIGTVAVDPVFVSTLSTERDARVMSLRVRPGDRVKAGDVLMTLAPLAMDSAQLEQSRATLPALQAESARLHKLRARGLASNDQVIAADKALADAKAVVDGLQRAGAEGTTLKASQDGVVLTLGAGTGQTLGAGAAAATIAGDSELLITAGLEPVDARTVKSGLAAALTLPHTGTPLPARVLSVGAAVDPATRFVNVTLAAPADAQLMPGATLSVAIDLVPVAGVIVPRAALMEDGDGVYVFVIAEGKALRRGVAVAFERGDEVLLQDGLAPGERVAIGGVASLSDGIAIREAET